MFFLGCIAFLLFFLSDCNDAFWRGKLPPLLFPLGAAALVISILLECLRRPAPMLPLWLRLLFAVLSLGFLLLEIYTLFFALPRKASYAEPGTKRSVYKDGMYALCRHPGVLWFAGLVFCLWPAAGLRFFSAAVYTGLDLLLIIFEDRLIFPRLMDGYDTYRRETPFLSPSRSSIRRCRQK